MTCICGPEWRNPNCDEHGDAQQVFRREAAAAAKDRDDLGAEILRRMNPLSVECPRCRAAPGVGCARPAYWPSDWHPEVGHSDHPERADAGLRQMLEWAREETARRRAALS